MNGRERVLAVMRRQPLDRLPTDFRSTPEVKERLKAHFGVATEEEYLRILGVDIRHMNPAYAGPALPVRGDGSEMNFWGVRFTRQENEFGAYLEVIAPPLANATTPTELDDYRWPDPDQFDYEGIVHTWRELEWKDYSLIIGVANPLYVYWNMRGMYRCLMDLVEAREMYQSMMDHIVGFYMGFWERVLRIAGDVVDFIRIEDDFGTQQGLLLSREMWRWAYRDRFRQMIDLAHSYGKYVYYHCCGSCRDLIPDFLEAGIDLLNPIQTSAARMVPEELKAEFGDRLVFHGAIDVQTTLPHGTPDDVRREVRHRISVLGAGGGYIVSPSHSLQADTPVENILALYEAAGSYRP